MKKLIKFIFGLFFFLLFIVIVIAIVIGILLFDNSHKGEKIEATDSEVVSSLTFNALETAKPDSKLSYTFDVITLNSLLGAISNSIKLDPLKINNIYTTYDNLEDDDNYNDTITLYIPLNIYFYDTCLIATINVTANDDSTFTLAITQAKIGKVDSNFFLIKTALDKAFNPEIVENELNKLGYNVDCDYIDGVFLLTLSANDIIDLVIKNAGDNILYKTTLELIKQNPDLYSVNFSGKSKGFEINLNTLSSEINNSKSFEYNSNPEEKAITKAEKLLTDGIIDQKQVPYVVDYLVRGYDNIEEEAQNVVKKINFSSINILVPENYKGIVSRKDTNILGVIASSTATISPLSPTVNVNLDDDNINAIIDDEKIIGKTFAFQKDNLINYITIGNIYITTNDHEIVLSVLADLNGKEIKMDVTLKADQIGTNYAITTTLTDVKIGSLEFDNDLQLALLNYLNDNVKSDVIKINPQAKTVTFDFNSYFNDSSLVALNAIKDHITKQIEVFDGYIQVRLIPTL